ncbi:MAG TPA: cytidine deaminase, partial [Polyangia bacterium]|nr:cytidine deaminase [Polyangia bacterium]
AVRRRAHAPYSKFTVGAAVLDERGRVHLGCNLENASYGLTVCAERNAVAAAVAGGARRIAAVAVASGAIPPALPCGACRQVLAELGAPDTEVLIAGPSGGAERTTLGDLLPRAFVLDGTLKGFRSSRDGLRRRSRPRPRVLRPRAT